MAEALTFISTISHQKESLFFVNIEEAIGLILTADGWLWPVGCVQVWSVSEESTVTIIPPQPAAGGPASRNTASPQSHSKLARVAQWPKINKIS